MSRLECKELGRYSNISAVGIRICPDWNVKETFTVEELRRLVLEYVQIGM